MRPLQVVDPIGRLRSLIASKYRRQKYAAEAWGVSATFVSMVLAGKKKPTAGMLDDAGIVRVVTTTYCLKESS